MGKALTAIWDTFLGFCAFALLVAVLWALGALIELMLGANWPLGAKPFVGLFAALLGGSLINLFHSFGREVISRR